MPACTRIATAGCLAAVLLTLAGCGSRRLAYAEVEGKVTLGGKPLPGVKVTFYPDSEEAEQLPYSTGTTDPSGAYVLTLKDGKQGALVGKNKVVVNWPVPERRGGPPPAPPIPLQYTVFDQTPLVFEVKEGGRQTIDLNLNLQ
jgi:hypothetical protein